MVRSVFADTSVEKYLDNLLEREEFSYGIIIGQVKNKKRKQFHDSSLTWSKKKIVLQATRQGKDSVIHLAKTSEDLPNDDPSEDSPSSSEVKNVKSINAEVLVDHCINALRMIPGSFFVLGIFVVSPQNVFDNQDDFKQLKTILQQMVE